MLTISDTFICLIDYKLPSKLYPNGGEIHESIYGQANQIKFDITYNDGDWSNLNSLGVIQNYVLTILMYL